MQTTLLNLFLMILILNLVQAGKCLKKPMFARLYLIGGICHFQT